MANPAATLPFSKFLIQIGDGANPENFTAPCGLTSRGWDRTLGMTETNVPDCDDEDAPSDVERDAVSRSSSLSGAGVVDDHDFDRWDDWAQSGESKNIKITLGTRVWIGAFKLSKFSVTAAKGGRTNFTATLDSDGAVTRQS